ncbi:Ubiquinone/menaquinone biosynthesis C-methyltransferase UbiE [uncultured archaeon]|nr:Ubiquinone/menaquinone biosynthesis C-methyltransferase UbiE [uncultured archaeon]
MFSRIADRYDIVNGMLSLGIDSHWRSVAVAEALHGLGECAILDVATGTGGVALAIASSTPGARVFAMDANDDMLSLAARKAERAGITRVVFETGDAHDLAYPDESFDAVVCGFGVRNFKDVGRYADEKNRDLKKGGRFVLLDMAMPSGRIISAFFSAYFGAVGVLGSLIDALAYGWLFSSIRNFDKRALAATLDSKQFKNVKTRDLFPGIAFIVTGEKA